MANELIHSSAGTVLTQAEYEAISGAGGHVLNSQATGDLIYASSATQLSRLGIGATNKVLTVIGGVPTWQSTLAGLTLTAPTINGTVATTGLTMPAFTLGGTITTGGNRTFDLTAGTLTLTTTGAWAGLTIQGTWNTTEAVQITGRVISASPAAIDNLLILTGAGKSVGDPQNNINYGSLHFCIESPTKGAETGMTIIKHAIAGVLTQALKLSSGGNLILNASAKIAPTSGVAGYAVVSTALTLGTLGSIIMPQGNMSGAADDAARSALAGNVAGAFAWDAADLSLWGRHTDGTWKHVHLA